MSSRAPLWTCRRRTSRPLRLATWRRVRERPPHGRHRDLMSCTRSAHGSRRSTRPPSASAYGGAVAWPRAPSRRRRPACSTSEFRKLPRARPARANSLAVDAEFAGDPVVGPVRRILELLGNKLADLLARQVRRRTLFLRAKARFSCSDSPARKMVGGGSFFLRSVQARYRWWPSRIVPSSSMSIGYYAALSDVGLERLELRRRHGRQYLVFVRCLNAHGSLRENVRCRRRQGPSRAPLRRPALADLLGGSGDRARRTLR